MSPAGGLNVVIVAAGRGRRLGRDKATLPWGPGTLLQHVLSQFEGPEVERRMVVLNPENEAAARNGLPGGVEVAVNPDPSADMLSSVRVGLSALGRFVGPLCVHPVDVFAVSPELIAMLYEAWSMEPERLHVPEVDGKGGHPLIVPPKLVSEVGRIPTGHGLNWLLLEHADAVVRHAWPDQALLADLDTPESYRRHRAASDMGARD